MKEDFRRHSVTPDGHGADKRQAIPGFREASGGSQKCNCAIHQMHSLLPACVECEIKCT